jgi:hypothetical protein
MYKMPPEQILPKGIVLNRNAVYEEIAKYDVLPVEQILRACHGKQISPNLMIRDV